MKDIETRKDILLIVGRFYELLLADERINFFFTKITSIDKHLDEHLETLATFWEQSLFLKGGYSNNMFQIHKNIHEKYPFKKEHYDIWLTHLNNAINTNFEGKYAEQMKTQALSMATVLQIKMQ
uniref:group III truncated hemoglobin n=1 Tax=Flavobacterium sp. TaxID=239 RepID=UPI00404B9A99